MDAYLEVVASSSPSSTIAPPDRDQGESQVESFSLSSSVYPRDYSHACCLRDLVE